MLLQGTQLLKRKKKTVSKGFKHYFQMNVTSYIITYFIYNGFDHFYCAFT